MQTQQHTYTRTGQADFSAALMRSSAAEASTIKATADPATAHRPNNRNSADNNRNLSSILSRITDDGPANLQVESDVSHIRQSRVAEPAVNKENSRNSNQAPGNLDQYAFAQSFAFDDPDIRNNDVAPGTGSRSFWQTLILTVLVSVIAVMGYLIYQLRMQAEEMQYAIDASQAQVMLESGTQQNNADVLPKLNSMDKALAAVQRELQGIKTDYQASDSRLAMDIPRDLEPHLLELAAASEIVSVLQDEFSRIQHEMDAMGSELKVIRKGIKPKQPVSQQPVAGSAIKADTPNLVVNLASLTTKDKAIAAMQKLQQSGVAPNMQQVMVNGKVVFRISVDGFRSRDAASAFIAEARQKYGFEGGWIRRF